MLVYWVTEGTSCTELLKPRVFGIEERFTVQIFPNLPHLWDDLACCQGSWHWTTQAGRSRLFAALAILIFSMCLAVKSVRKCQYVVYVVFTVHIETHLYTSDVYIIYTCICDFHSISMYIYIYDRIWNMCVCILNYCECVLINTIQRPADAPIQVLLRGTLEPSM